MAPMDDDKTLSLEAINKEAVDLENIPVEEVFEKLKCMKDGLNTDEVEKRLNMFGYNKLEEKKKEHQPPDYHDFGGILILLLINLTISFVEENNAGNGAAALMARLAPKAKVLRNGKWNKEDTSILVPGDIISINLGDIIPADARLLEGDALKIDQSALTGESFPVTKNPGDGVYSGSTCKQGEIVFMVCVCHV